MINEYVHLPSTRTYKLWAATINLIPWWNECANRQMKIFLMLLWYSWKFVTLHWIACRAHFKRLSPHKCHVFCSTKLDGTERDYDAEDANNENYFLIFLDNENAIHCREILCNRACLRIYFVCSFKMAQFYMWHY